MPSSTELAGSLTPPFERPTDARGDLQNTAVDSLTHQVANANALFDKVNRPSEAILDSRVLIATSEAGALKARQLKFEAQEDQGWTERNGGGRQ